MFKCPFRPTLPCETQNRFSKGVQSLTLCRFVDSHRRQLIVFRVKRPLGKAWMREGLSFFNSALDLEKREAAEGKSMQKPADIREHV